MAKILPLPQSLDWEEMLELSDISAETVATTKSPTDKTMMHGLTEKRATSSSFSERVKKTLENFFPFTIGTGTGEEVETQKEEEDDDEQDDLDDPVVEQTVHKLIETAARLVAKRIATGSELTF